MGGAAREGRTRVAAQPFVAASHVRAPRLAPIAPTLSAYREQGLAEDYERRWYVGCPLEVRPVPNKGRVR